MPTENDAPEVQMMDPSKLIPYAKNNKRHSEKEITKLAGLIAEYGFDQPIVIDRHNVIVKGHKRREAALKLKMAQVPVIVTALDEYEIAANRIADNKVVSTEYDDSALRHELSALKEGGFDMSLTGFDSGEVARLTSSLSGAAAEAVKAAPMPSLKAVAAAAPARKAEPPPLPTDAQAEAVGITPEAAKAPRTFLAFAKYKVPMLQEELDALTAAFDKHTTETGTQFGFVANLLA